MTQCVDDLVRVGRDIEDVRVIGQEKVRKILINHGADGVVAPIEFGFADCSALALTLHSFLG